MLRNMNKLHNTYDKNKLYSQLAMNLDLSFGPQIADTRFE